MSGRRTRRNIHLLETLAVIEKQEYPVDEAGNLPGRSRGSPRLGRKGISYRKERQGPPGKPRQASSSFALSLPALPRWKISAPLAPEREKIRSRGRDQLATDMSASDPHSREEILRHVSFPEVRSRGRLHLVWPMIPSTSQSIFPRLSIDQNSPAFTLSAPLLSLIGPAKTSFLPSTKLFLVSFTSLTAS